MTMYMYKKTNTDMEQSDIICITNRRLCGTDFLVQVEKIAGAHPKAIILREKDLSEQEYESLGTKVVEICKKYNTPCILHSFPHAAKKLGCNGIHLPLPLLEKMTVKEKKGFSVLGASCHSLEDALRAWKLGCTYITVGHIFDTDCKAGIPGRGLDFLKEICGNVEIPVYAIGGIAPENIKKVKDAGAFGACVMSGLMKAADPVKYLEAFKERENDI